MPAAGQQDVGRLDVAVDDPAAVCLREPFRDLARDGEHLVRRERTTGDPLLEAAPFDQRHRDVGPALVLAGLVDRADVWVVERGGGLGLAQEPRARRRIGRQVVGQELQRDRAAKPDVLGAVDDAHPAAAQLAEDPVPAGDEPPRLHAQRLLPS